MWQERNFLFPALFSEVPMQILLKRLQGFPTEDRSTGKNLI